jgi:hypothetical protein
MWWISDAGSAVPQRSSRLLTLTLPCETLEGDDVGAIVMLVEVTNP